MVGYPIGLWDEVNNMPLVRKGITSYHPSMDFEGKSIGITSIINPKIYLDIVLNKFIFLFGPRKNTFVLPLIEIMFVFLTTNNLADTGISDYVTKEQ